MHMPSGGLQRGSSAGSACSWAARLALAIVLCAGLQLSADAAKAAEKPSSSSFFVNDWKYVGPFVVGKGEWDGEPDFDPDGERAPYHSELVAGGNITGWRSARAGRDGMVTIAFDDVDWNGLVQALASIELLEFQAWAVGSFAMEREAPAFVRCGGAASFYLDGSPDPIAGDLYHKGDLGHAVRLARGTHTVKIRVRAKVRGQLRCSVELNGPPLRLAPLFAPDLVDGSLFGSYAAVAVTNGAPGAWIRSVRAEIAGSGPLLLDLPAAQPAWPDLAPGQTLPLRLRLRLAGGRPTATCPPPAVVRVSGRVEGSGEAAAGEARLEVRCRRRGQSFVFTFLDADGSVQHAGAVHPPAGACDGPCPVLVTLHGTTVSASDSADAYKHKPRRAKDYVFGAEHGWLLAPSRHGAHNWENIGALHAMAALRALAELTADGPERADPYRLVVAGHSMGGHGAWVLGQALPDRLQALVAHAGWIRKEHYGDSNAVLLHDVAAAHVDPALRRVLEAADAPSAADLHAPTLLGVPVFTRVGAADRTVHPWFSRRMLRVLRAEGVAHTHREVPGMEHWWWDTTRENDGGAVNDEEVRAFVGRHMGGRRPPAPGGPLRLRLVVHGPGAAGTRAGFRVLQQAVPQQRATLDIELLEGSLWRLRTRNVRRIGLEAPPPGRGPLAAAPHVAFDAGGRLEVDGVALPPAALAALLAGNATLLRAPPGAARWRLDAGPAELLRRGERTHADAGPVRQALERPHAIVYAEGSAAARAAAPFLANLAFMTGHAHAAVLSDAAPAAAAAVDGSPAVVLVGPTRFGARAAADVAAGPGGVRAGGCLFAGPGRGLVALAPLLGPAGERAGRLALLVAGSDEAGVRDATWLAAPTIPPMARQPYTNQAPDFIVTGPEARRLGPGAFLAAGFYDAAWRPAPAASFLSDCVPPEAAEGEGEGGSSPPPAAKDEL